MDESRIPESPGETPRARATSRQFEDASPGCRPILASGGEITALPFIFGVVGCAGAGWWVGSVRLPGNGAEYLLAALGGLVGIYVGFALAMAALGALLGWPVGWSLWYAGRAVGADADPLFWSPI